MRVFSHDPDVVRIGVEYLHIAAWSFVASGVVFVSSSMFQALGNTVPPLITSVSRITLIAIPIIVLSRQPGFDLKTIWYHLGLRRGAADGRQPARCCGASSTAGSRRSWRPISLPCRRSPL